jgi:hypothetical protein
MDMEMKTRFERLWARYFGAAELPVTFFYAKDQPPGTQMPSAPSGQRCVIGDLSKARAGKNLAFVAEVIGCAPSSSTSSPMVFRGSSRANGTRNRPSSSGR